MRFPSSPPLSIGLALLALCGGLAVSATVTRAAEMPAGPLAIGTKPVDFAALHNVVRLSEKLYSGGVPEGEAGFAALQRLGVRTIITVDGARPEVALARKYGLRYVHLPFGYDGCPTPTANRIARAVRDLPGPIYLHCHHGKHRSPAAAAFARIAVDGLSNAEAVRELERAGTGKNYTGLYGDVQAYRPPTPAELDRVPADFPEVAALLPLVDSMVAIEKRFDRLMQLQKAGWKAPPGVDAAYEALQLQELYTELNRLAETRKRPKDYRDGMTAGERDGQALKKALRSGKREEAGLALGRLAAGCGGCHARHRNVPQPKGD